MLLSRWKESVYVFSKASVKAEISWNVKETSILLTKLLILQKQLRRHVIVKFARVSYRRMLVTLTRGLGSVAVANLKYITYLHLPMRTSFSNVFLH